MNNLTLCLVQTVRFSTVCPSGAGAALAGVLRAGHYAPAVDPAPRPGV